VNDVCLSFEVTFMDRSTKNGVVIVIGSQLLHKRMLLNR